VFQPPLAIGTVGWERWMFVTAAFRSDGIEYRRDSRFVIMRSGPEHTPDVYYMVWEGHGFRQLRHIRGSPARLPNWLFWFGHRVAIADTVRSCRRA